MTTTLVMIGAVIAYFIVAILPILSRQTVRSTTAFTLAACFAAWVGKVIEEILE